MMYGIKYDKIDEVVINMERDCYNYVIGICQLDNIDTSLLNNSFTQRYSAEIYKHVSNMKKYLNYENGMMYDTPCDIDYGYKILNNDFANVGGLSSEMINPIASLDERKYLKIRYEQKLVEKFTNEHPCKMCSSRNVKVVPTPGRSLGSDELSGFKYECFDCEHYWT